MLKQLRGTLKSVVASIVIVPLIIAFAAWGVPEVRQFGRNHAVSVGRDGISPQEVSREFDRFVTNRRNQSNGEFDREAALAAGLPDQVVQSMATQLALKHEAERLGLLVPRTAVREFLQSTEQFKNPATGKFDNDALSRIMTEYNYGVREFEDRIQSDLVRNQLMAAVAVGGSAPKAFVDALVLRETEARTISYLTMTEDLAGAAPTPTPKILKEYHQKNAAQFMSPEYRTFSAIILKNSDFADKESMSEDALRKLYDASKAKYETPERRTIYQLTLDDEAKAKAAVAALNGRTPFERLAVDNGKSLADVTYENILKSDILDPKVADAAFSASASGAVAGPIKGVFGYTIAQVASVAPASVKPFHVTSWAPAARCPWTSVRTRRPAVS